MRKLSNAQAVALMSIRLYNDLRGVKNATYDVLSENGLIAPIGPNSDVEVTEKGETEYTRATTCTLPPKNEIVADIASDETVATREEALLADHTEALIQEDLGQSESAEYDSFGITIPREQVAFRPTTIYPVDHAFALTVVGTSDRVSEDTGERMVWVTYPEYPDLAAEEISPTFYTAYPKADAPAAPAPTQRVYGSDSNMLRYGKHVVVVVGTALAVLDGETIADGVEVTVPGSGEVWTITMEELMEDDVKAVCGHVYAAKDRCPGCDAEDDAILNTPGHKVAAQVDYTAPAWPIFLGHLVLDSATLTYSAISPRAEIIARRTTSASANRALVLEHKRFHMVGAYNENVLFDARKLEERSGESLTTLHNAQQIDDTVRLLSSLGITTGEQFIARLTALQDQELMESELLGEDWESSDLGEKETPAPERRSEHSDRLALLALTHPVVTDVRDDSEL